MSSSNVFIIAGGSLSAIGAALIGMYGLGLAGALDTLSFTVGQSTSPALDLVVPAFAGGALCLAGLAAAQLGVYQGACSAVVSLAARCSFLLVGVSLVAGGALLAHGMGASIGFLDSLAQSSAAPQAAEVKGFLVEFEPTFRNAGWLLIFAPCILIAAMLLGTDATRKPGPTSLPAIVPTVGVGLAALIGLGCFAWAWSSAARLKSLFAGNIVKPSEIAAAINALLFAGLVIAVLHVLVAMPLAMSALSMSSEEETTPGAEEKGGGD